MKLLEAIVLLPMLLLCNEQAQKPIDQHIHKITDQRTKRVVETFYHAKMFHGEEIFYGFQPKGEYYLYMKINSSGKLIEVGCTNKPSNLEKIPVSKLLSSEKKKFSNALYIYRQGTKGCWEKK